MHLVFLDKPRPHNAVSCGGFQRIIATNAASDNNAWAILRLIQPILLPVSAGRIADIFADDFPPFHFDDIKYVDCVRRGDEADVRLGSWPIVLAIRTYVASRPDSPAGSVCVRACGWAFFFFFFSFLALGQLHVYVRNMIMMDDAHAMFLHLETHPIGEAVVLQRRGGRNCEASVFCMRLGRPMSRCEW
jgi:hypothetical protein